MPLGSGGRAPLCYPLVTQWNHTRPNGTNGGFRTLRPWDDGGGERHPDDRPGHPLRRLGLPRPAVRARAGRRRDRLRRRADAGDLRLTGPDVRAGEVRRARLQRDLRAARLPRLRRRDLGHDRDGRARDGRPLHPALPGVGSEPRGQPGPHAAHPIRRRPDRAGDRHPGRQHLRCRRQEAARRGQDRLDPLLRVRRDRGRARRPDRGDDRRLHQAAAGHDVARPRPARPRGRPGDPDARAPRDRVRARQPRALPGHRRRARRARARRHRRPPTHAKWLGAQPNPGAGS